MRQWFKGFPKKQYVPPEPLIVKSSDPVPDSIKVGDVVKLAPNLGFPASTMTPTTLTLHSHNYLLVKKDALYNYIAFGSSTLLKIVKFRRADWTYAGVDISIDLAAYLGGGSFSNNTLYLSGNYIYAIYHGGATVIVAYNLATGSIASYSVGTQFRACEVNGDKLILMNYNNVIVVSYDGVSFTATNQLTFPSIHSSTISWAVPIEPNNFYYFGTYSSSTSYLIGYKVTQSGTTLSSVQTPAYTRFANITYISSVRYVRYNGGCYLVCTGSTSPYQYDIAKVNMLNGDVETPVSIATASYYLSYGADTAQPVISVIGDETTITEFYLKAGYGYLHYFRKGVGSYNLGSGYHALQTDEGVMCYYYDRAYILTTSYNLQQVNPPDQILPNVEAMYLGNKKFQILYTGVINSPFISNHYAFYFKDKRGFTPIKNIDWATIDKTKYMIYYRNRLYLKS